MPARDTQSCSVPPILVVITTSTWLGFALTYLFGAYLGRGSLDTMIAFQAGDAPPVPPGIVGRGLGIHYFGDFLQPYYQAGLKPSPYLAGSSSYTPAANGFFWLAHLVPYWIAFSIFLLSSLSLLVLPFLRMRQQCSTSMFAMIVGPGLLFTFPVVASIDRGNIQILVAGLSVSALVFLQKNRSTSAAVLIGCAAALKIYPILLLTIFFRRRYFRALISGLFTVLTTTLIPLLLFDGGFANNLRLFVDLLTRAQENSATDYLAYGNSLRALESSLGILGATGVAGVIGNLHYVLVGLGIVSLCCVACRSRIALTETLLCASSLMILSTGFAATYSLVSFVPCLWILYTSKDFRPNWVATSYNVLLGLLFMPKLIPVLFWKTNFQPSSPSLGSILNPLILLALFLTALTSSLITSRRTKEWAKP